MRKSTSRAQQRRQAKLISRGRVRADFPTLGSEAARALAPPFCRVLGYHVPDCDSGIRFCIYCRKPLD